MGKAKIEKRKPGRPSGSKDKGDRKVNPKSLANLKPKEAQNPDWAEVKLPIVLPRELLQRWRAMSPKQRGQAITELLTG